MITKSGTNSYHGSAYCYDTETALNANDFLSKKAGNPTPQFCRQQFGGAIGGPVRQDKDFLFFALERQREHTSSSVGSLISELNLLVPLGAQPAQEIPTPYFDWRYNRRYDHRFNDNHSAFFTYSVQTNRCASPKFCPALKSTACTLSSPAVSAMTVAYVPLRGIRVGPAHPLLAIASKPAPRKSRSPTTAGRAEAQASPTPDGNG